MDTSPEPPPDEFTTLREHARAALTVHGSRFLARAVPVGGKEECEEILGGIRKEYFDATHHPYAYRLSPGGMLFRAYDDGEPSGTAGRPILGAIDGAGLTGVLVVVTRYFGGTKLGAGGLARAYRDAARDALRAGGRSTQYLCDTVGVTVSHALVGPVLRAVAAAGGRIADSRYGEEVEMAIEIRRSRSAGLRSALLEGTAGAARVTVR
ncbi:MAG TPA: YigZ family protein [Bacteroidota bacterium]|nr:YigZ family protein [Bacteroidota bacterium]